MMRVPGAYATAVRTTEGDIQIDRHEFISIIDKYPLLKIPIIRGIFGLFEALRIGYSSLHWSSEIIISNEKDYNGPNKITDVLITIFSLFLALGLFFVAPEGPAMPVVETHNLLLEILYKFNTINSAICLLTAPYFIKYFIDPQIWSYRICLGNGICFYVHECICIYPVP